MNATTNNDVARVGLAVLALLFTSLRFEPCGTAWAQPQPFLERENANAQSADREPSNGEDSTADCLCDQLIRRFLSGGKVDSSMISAASEIAQRHCRGPRSIEQIMSGLVNPDGSGNRDRLRLLGRMLAVDAESRREYAQPAERRRVRAMGPPPPLDKTVVEQLRTMADRLGSPAWRPFVIAIAKAEDPGSIDWLRSVLRRSSREGADATAFHAAVGLANLADPEGVLWLIDHVESPGGELILDGFPRDVFDGSLSACCQKALQILSGRTNAITRDDFLRWWQEQAVPFVPVKTATLLQP
jgi:hypothetical protein